MASRAVNTRQLADLEEINSVLGRKGRGTQVVVGGVNPQCLTCDDMIVRGNMVIRGKIASSMTFAGGAPGDPIITFANGSAGFFSPTAGTIGVAAAGATVCSFDSAGVHTANISSPSGTLDFGGASLTGISGISGITANPYVYDIVGSRCVTQDSEDIAVITVPMSSQDKSLTLDLHFRVMYVLANCAGAVSGVFSGYARADKALGIEAPNMTNLYDTTTYANAALAGVQMYTRNIANAAQLRVVGLPEQTIIWHAKCSVIKIES